MSEMYGTMDRFVGCFVCVCVFFLWDEDENECTGGSYLLTAKTHSIFGLVLIGYFK